MFLSNSSFLDDRYGLGQYCRLLPFDYYFYRIQDLKYVLLLDAPYNTNL